MNMYVPKHGQHHLAQAIGLAIGALLLAIAMNTIFGGRGTTGTFRPEAVPTPPPTSITVTAAPSPVPYPPPQ